MLRRDFLKKLGFGAAAASIPGATVLGNKALKEVAEDAGLLGDPKEVVDSVIALDPKIPVNQTDMLPKYWAEKGLEILTEQMELRRKLEAHIENIDTKNITDEGVEYALNCMFEPGFEPVDDWEVGLIDEDKFTGLHSGDTYNDHIGWREATEERQSFDKISSASFEITTSRTIRGAFIASPSREILYSTSMFNQAPICLVNGDRLAVSYTVQGLV